MTDDSAVKKTQQGDTDAFRVLVDRHARSVFRLAYRMTNSQQDADDVVQETFLKAWKQIDKFDGRAGFATWLHRIGTNCALDVMRRRQRKQEVQPHSSEDAGDGDSLTRIASGAPDPERLARSAQAAAVLGPALNELSDMERMAFVLRHHEGLCIEDISVSLGVQPGAAKHAVFRAVQKLRRSLEPLRGASA